ALVGVILSGETTWILALAVAVFGNVLGAVVNWGIGYYWPQRPRAEQSAILQRAASWFERYGVWSLLFSWLPLIGDPLTVIAGLAKVKILPFFVIVLLGKTVRYGLILATVWSAV
ncbi:MAG: VTT domain-containing protein, partial [Paracoccaceae bacterium]